MDFSYPATLAWPALRYLLLWSFLLLWQYVIFVFLCSPADGSDSSESDHLSDDSAKALPNDASDSWSDYDSESNHALAWAMRVHLPCSFRSLQLFNNLPRSLAIHPSRRYGPLKPRYGFTAPLEGRCQARHCPGWTPYHKASQRQPRFSSTAVVPPSNTPLTRNITKAFERAPGMWPP